MAQKRQIPEYEILKLKLTDTESLVFRAYDKVDVISFCDDIEIDFLSAERYRLSLDCFQYLLRSFTGSLQAAIDHKLALHPSIKHDLGYLWNEEFSDVSSLDFHYEITENNKFWIGGNYEMFSTPGNFDPKLITWLYNNDQGEIILEITPIYKWYFSDPEPGENYCTYDEFIKNYQPILFRTIPKKIAREWVKQAQELLQKVESHSCNDCEE